MDMFASTLKAFENGAGKIAASAAIKNIEFWENKLSGVDVAGTKSVVRDLGALKKELSSDTPDKAHVKSIMARLADETKKVATHVKGPEADGIQTVAECLSKA